MRKHSFQKYVWQSVYNRLPLHVRKRAGGRHAKKFKLHLSSRRLLISLRSFRTAKATRTQVLTQFVVPIYVGRCKEVAITYSRSRRRKSAKHQVIMRLRPATYAMILAGTIGSVYFGQQVTLPAAAAPLVVVQSATTKVTVPKPIEPVTPIYATASEPTHIHIPRLHLDAPIQATGQKSDGTLEVPKATDTVGWYKNSPTPGELGPAVIAGHVDSTSGPAVFWRLGELQVGDTFEINRADGSLITFKVDAIKQYSQDNLPADEVYGDIDYAGIRLITCSGTFNRQTHHYTDNTVVYGSVVY
jgi:LPXTG-site transpeptidase (sortase) family protein